jgi:hypothetical protein
VILVLKDLAEDQVVLDQQDLLVHQALPEELVRQGLRAFQGLEELMASVVHLGHKELRVVLERPVSQDRQAVLVLLDHLERLEIQEHQELLASQEVLVIQDHLELLELMVTQEHQDHKVVPALRVLQDLQERLVLAAVQELPANPVDQDLLVL